MYRTASAYLSLSACDEATSPEGACPSCLAASELIPRTLLWARRTTAWRNEMVQPTVATAVHFGAVRVLLRRATSRAGGVKVAGQPACLLLALIYKVDDNASSHTCPEDK